MIKILAKSYSPSVSYLCGKLDSELTHYDVNITNDTDSAKQCILNAVNSSCQSLIIVGNVGESCSLFSETLNLAMFYDKFAERNILQYCKLAKVDEPPQHVLDKLCLAPETFNHYGSAYGYQCACHGEYNKCQVFLIPDDLRECTMLYDNYIRKNLFQKQAGLTRYIFKIFGLSQKDVASRLNAISRVVSRKCETVNLDTKIALTFPAKCNKNFINETLKKVKELFGDYLYATADQTLAFTVVELLKSLGKTISVAESVTGGMIASSLVDISGASSVLYEGVVTYSISSKCKRLGINPHFIDEHGVVSQQVAQAMAEGLRKNGCDAALSITGIAGPTSEDGLPVGLCYIGISTAKGVAVYKNVFAGDRNSIRQQAANMALYFVYKTLTK